MSPDKGGLTVQNYLFGRGDLVETSVGRSVAQGGWCGTGGSLLMNESKFKLL